jgi:hypothetical protein
VGDSRHWVVAGVEGRSGRSVVECVCDERGAESVGELGLGREMYC